MSAPPRFPRQLLEALRGAGLHVGDTLTPEAIDRLAAAFATAEATAMWNAFEATLPPARPADARQVSSWPGPFVVST
jgi:hypothetical protein